MKRRVKLTNEVVVKHMVNKQRNSNIELLKIIAMIMIVFSHGMPDGDTEMIRSAINLGTATTNVQYFVIGLIHNMGQIGNDIFIVCSAWFLLDSNATKVKKIASMIGDCFAISVIMVLFFL